jgi:coenzyme Q-binding protein COQ10
MRTHKETYSINANKETIFNVIANIENYPTFLPWCIGARITDTNKLSDILIQKAELVIAFNSFRESFFSDIQLNRKNWTINIQSNKKPFKSLNGQWVIHEKDNHCEVSFEIKFEFKSIILEKIIGVVFFKAVKSIVRAFEEQCLKNDNLIS